MSTTMEELKARKRELNAELGRVVERRGKARDEAERLAVISDAVKVCGEIRVVEEELDSLFTQELETRYLPLLRAHDDAQQLKRPTGFDRAAAVARFTRMAREVVKEFPGSRFESGAEIGNESFHGQVFVAFDGTYALVRASNFGGFMAFMGEPAERLSRGERGWLVELFETHGYTYIPPGAVSARYDGAWRGEPKFSDWGGRFFERNV